MTNRITAFRIAVAQLQDNLEEGQLVRVDEGALAEADLDEAEFEEELDNEHDYERLGFILEIYEDDFPWVDHEEDESITVEVGDEPVYLVGMAPSTAGAHPFMADDLEPVNRDDVLGDLDIDADPEDVADGEDEEESWENSEVDRGVTELRDVSDVPGITRTQMGLSPWPRSWRNSNKPARLIAMDAWISMGRSFRGCRRSVVGSVRNPNRLCASFKDSLYGTTRWRSGG